MKPLPLVSRCPDLGRRFSRRYAMSTTSQSHEEPLSRGTQLKGEPGRMYSIEEVPTDRRKPLICVYRARYGSFKEHSAFVVSVINCRTAESAYKESYAIKNMIPGEFEYRLNLQRRLSACPNVRSVVDTSIYLYTHSLPESPESWCRSRQNQASDVFSFVIVVRQSLLYSFSALLDTNIGFR